MFALPTTTCSTRQALQASALTCHVYAEGDFGIQLRTSAKNAKPEVHS